MASKGFLPVYYCRECKMVRTVLGGRNVGEAYSVAVNRERRTQAGTRGDRNPTRPIPSDQLLFARPCFLEFQCSKYRCRHFMACREHFRFQAALAGCEFHILSP